MGPCRCEPSVDWQGTGHLSSLKSDVGQVDVTQFYQMHLPEENPELHHWFLLERMAISTSSPTIRFQLTPISFQPTMIKFQTQ